MEVAWLFQPPNQLPGLSRPAQHLIPGAAPAPASCLRYQGAVTLPACSPVTKTRLSSVAPARPRTAHGSDVTVTQAEAALTNNSVDERSDESAGKPLS